MFDQLQLFDGVEVHTFLDGSGCVFFKCSTSEITVLTLQPKEIENKLISGNYSSELQLLVDNEYIQPIQTT